MGKVLEKVKNWWIQNDFKPKKKECEKNMLKVYLPTCRGGNDIRIASIFQFVCNPNFVPLSYRRLNSVYLDLLRYWISLSFALHLKFLSF